MAYAASACREAAPALDEPATLELDGETIQLARGVQVVEIEVARASAGREFEPASAATETGDVVRFIARDGHSHAVAFDGAALEPAALAFLERTGQLRGPPLLNDGTSWIVSLDGAPPGDYPYVCLTHDQRGVIAVAPG